MKYNIAVLGSAFEPALISRMEEAAKANGCAISFYQNHDEALPHLADVDIFFGPSDARSPEMAKAMPRLQWFASYYAGVDPLLPAGRLPEHVILTNGSGAYGVTIAEHMIMVSLMMLRRYPEYYQMVREKNFSSDLMIGSLYGATIVVCGTGDIGSKFAQRLRPFCPARVIGLNRTGRAAEGFDEVYPITKLDEILPQADILALTLPGTQLTNDLINQQRIAAMKRGSYILNVGRGNSIDQEAIIDALKEGHLAGAALDVFRVEPVPQEDPAWTTEGLLFTPHCSGKMTMAYTRQTLVDTFCENLARFCHGEEMVHVVDRTLGY